MLTKLEKDEKPLRAKKEEFEVAKAIHESEISELKAFCESQLLLLSEAISSKFEDTSDKVKSEHTKLCSNIDDLLKMQSDTRKLLSATRPHLVKEFKPTKTAFKSTCSELEIAVKSKITISSIWKSDVLSMFEKMFALVRELDTRNQNLNPHLPETALNAKQNSETETKADTIKRQTRSILNKLTPQNFSVLSKQMAGMDIDSDDLLIEVIDIIFEKACLEPNRAEAYANMCRTVLTIRGANIIHQQNQIQAECEESQVEDPVVKNFRRYLLTRCQNEFQNGKDYDKEFEVKLEAINTSEDAENVKKEKLRALELEHKKLKKKYFGNIRFVGELFKLDFITEKIMHSCIEILFKTKDEDSLECLCQFLTTIGRKMDHDAGKNLMDHYFKQIKQIVADKQASPRIRSMLSVLVELRDDKWVSRNITQKVIWCEDEHKRSLLLDLLDASDPTTLTLIFVETDLGVDALETFLSEEQFAVASFYLDQTRQE